MTFATALCHSLRRWPTDSALLATDCVLLRALAVVSLRRTGTYPCSVSERLRIASTASEVSRELREALEVADN